MPSQTTREQLTQAMRAVPFRPVMLELTNGERIVIDRPECIAFDPVGTTRRVWPEFVVLLDHSRTLGSFDEIVAISISDEESIKI